MAYTTQDILNSVKRNNTIFSTDFRFNDSDILEMIDEEIESTIVPMILRLHSDRLIFNEPLEIEANKNKYPVPYRAIGSNLKTLWYQDKNENPKDKKELEPLEYSNACKILESGTPNGYCFIGDDIVVVPKPSTTNGHLIFSYFIRHSKLVSSAQVAIVSSMNFETGEVTLATNANKNFTGRYLYDFIAANQRCKPHILSIDSPVIRIDANKMFFNTELLPRELRPGDRVALAGQTDVLLLPDECYKYLVKVAGIKILEAQKDLQALEAFKGDLDRARNIMEGVLSPRVTGHPRPYVNGNRLLSQSKIKRAINI